MPDNDTTEKTPNDLLAEQIVEELSTAGLVPENRRAELESKLKVGGASQDDWGLWIDMATSPESSGEGSDEQAD